MGFISNTGRAAQDPEGCTANNLNVNIGVTANNVTNGTLVTWFVTVQNPDLPTSCAVTLGGEGLYFICPGPDGTPTGTRTTLIPGGTTLRPGYGLQRFEIDCLVNVSGTTAEAKVAAPGSVVHKNPLQDDPANVDKTISVNVYRPCLQLDSVCNSAVNPHGNSVTVTYSGTLVNCGNIVLQNVLVYADRPTAGTLVFGPLTLAAGARTNFTASYVQTENLCGPFPTVLTASGVAPLDVPAEVSATASSQCTITYQPAILVTKNCPATPVQPGGVLTISGVVSNAGNITLTNVTVVNNKPAANTLLLGPITLGVGQTAAYSGSYPVAEDSCPPYADTVLAQGSSICDGTRVSNQASASCPGINFPSLVVTRACPTTPVLPGGRLTYTGTVTNTGNVTLNDVRVLSDKPYANYRIYGPATLAPGAGATFSAYYTVPADDCGPYTNILVASGRDKCFSVYVSNTVVGVCPGAAAPAIRVGKVCPPSPVQPGSTLSYTGSVTNVGNVTLTSVTVYNGETRVYGPATLAPNAKANFSGSYTVPPDSCGPYVDTLFAQGTSSCGDLVTDSTTVACPGTNTPGIRVTKTCPPNPVPPGGLLEYSGTVANSGNITLTNVTVVNTMPAPNTVVFGPATLAPGAVAEFSGRYTVPLDSCGPYSDTIVARGADKCFGKVVTSSVTTPCPGTSSPGVSISQDCPPVPTPIGGVLTFTATVFNTGDITLTNVVVVNDRPAAGTVVFRAAALAPGAATNFTGSFPVPANLNACAIANTLRVTAQNTCNAVVVSDEVTRVCPVESEPSIRVVKTCPAVPVQPGGVLTYTGTVTNTGNVTLTNVTVHSGETRLYGPATLAPNAGAAFVGSTTVPPDSCGPYADTITAHGTSLCGDLVTHSTTVACPGTNTPAIRVTKTCPPNPVPPGQWLEYSGTVANSGNVTLTNVTVVNTMPAPNTVVFGPATLAPGAVAEFSGRYTVPLDSCGPYSDTIVARGADKCFGKVVTSSVTTPCPGTSSPGVSISQDCPPVPAPIGGVLTFTATVFNTGDITLTNVVVVNDRPAAGTVVFRAAALAPGAATNFTGSFPVPANLNACAIANTLAVTGRDKCSGTTVSSTVTRTCPVISAPSIQVTKTCPETPVAPGGVLTFGGSVRNDGNVTLSNVTVVVDRPSPGTVVYTVASLEPGATASFAGSYPAPLNECSVTDTLTATAVDRCGNPVSDRTTTLCALTTTPRLAISRTCPPPVPPGGQMVLQGWVTNTGNITLTNVTVVIDRPAANTRVFGPVTLVPGQAAPFQGSFTVPADIAACSITSMLTVRGNDLCTGASVSSMAAATCPLLTSPRILVTKSCPAAPTPQGSPLVFSGTVANIGDSVLTNIVVVNNQPASNTVVFAALRLLPGQMTNFTGSYIVPTNCCEVCDTLTASGRNECNGLAVYDTATAICPVKFAPQIRITKTCPEQPTPIGEVLTYSGVVSNAGNVTLSDVVAYHSITGKRHRILEVAALAPGEAEFFTASFTVPEDFCEPDTVAVEARSICGNTPVTDSVTSACPVETAPNIDIVEVSAAQPVSAGQPGTFVGTVVNSGNVTLTNVVVAGSMPAPNTLVLGPLTLVPGETRVFSHSYAVPQDCNCCLLVNSYTARGWNRCESVQVAATTTIVTPYLTRPGIVVSLECPAGSSPGQTASVAGRVMNSGDVALTNVVVVRDGTTRLAGPISLVRGETHDFVTPYTPGAVVNVVATANDACTGATVSDADLCGAPLITSIAVAEGTVTLRWTSQPGTTYRVQSHANLIEGAWGNEPGDVTSSGTTCTKTLTLPAGTESRFYRVLVVPST